MSEGTPDRFLPDTLQVYSEGDKEFEKELIDSYKQSITEHLPKLTEALKNNDANNSILRSHDIKGSSSYIGAEAVRVVSEKMETLCRNSNLKEAAAYLAELKRETTLVFKLLDKYVNDEPLELTQEDEKEANQEEEEEKKEKKEEKKEDKKEEEKEDNKANNKDNKEDKKEKENSTTKATDTKKQDKD